MTFVRGVMAASIFVSSIFMVSGRISTKTKRAPARTKALAVLENVKLGKMTSSPGVMLHKRAAMSKADDPYVVINALGVLNRCSIQREQRFVNGPSPDVLWDSITCLIYSNSIPVNGGTFK